MKKINFNKNKIIKISYIILILFLIILNYSPLSKKEVTTNEKLIYEVSLHSNSFIIYNENMDNYLKNYTNIEKSKYKDQDIIKNSYSSKLEFYYYEDDINLNLINDSNIEIIKINNNKIDNLNLKILIDFLALFLAFIYIFNSLKANKKLNKKDILISIIGFLLIILIDYILSLIFEITSKNQLYIELIMKQKLKILIIISSIFLSPILEDYIFRELLYYKIKNVKVYIILNSLIFGLLHIILDNNLKIALINSISYITSGLIFTIIYLKTKNVKSSILTHILVNLLNTIFII